MGIANEVRRKKAEKAQLAEEQAEDNNEAAEMFFAYLDEVAPEVIEACAEQTYRPQAIKVGPTGLSKSGWVIPTESQEGSSAVAFFPDGDWQFAEPAPAGVRFNYQTVPHWAAIRGVSSFLLDSLTKDEIHAVIVDFLSDR